MISQLSKNTWLGRKISQFPGGFTVLLDLVLFLKCSNLASFECASVCRTWVLESNTICKWILPPPVSTRVPSHPAHGQHRSFFIINWQAPFLLPELLASRILRAEILLYVSSGSRAYYCMTRKSFRTMYWNSSNLKALLFSSLPKGSYPEEAINIGNCYITRADPMKVIYILAEENQVNEISLITVSACWKTI